MAAKTSAAKKREQAPEGMDALRQSPMMAHLVDSMEQGKDVGHYGRIVFTMVARFFLDDDAIAALLAKNPGVSELDAKATVLEVKAHDYSPPHRTKVLAWQRQQEFPICPDPDDPNGCDVYKDLRFPPDVYEHIQEFYEEKVREQEDDEK